MSAYGIMKAFPKVKRARAREGKDAPHQRGSLMKLYLLQVWAVFESIKFVMHFGQIVTDRSTNNNDFITVDQSDVDVEQALCV